MWRFVALLACVGVASATLVAAGEVSHRVGELESSSSSIKPPNVLVLLIDDMGYSDLGCFGSPNNTSPNIDKLVGEGLRFTQWISGASICTPSRASIQTGRYPIRTGCMGNVERYRVVPTPSNGGGLDPDKHVSIARALKEGAGYATGMAGKVGVVLPFVCGAVRRNTREDSIAEQSRAEQSIAEHSIA